MMLTEEEAKTKWCPHARVGNDAGCNRYPMENDAAYASAFAKCIGSACMAWREHVMPEHQEKIYNQPKRPDGEGWLPFSDSATNCSWARLVPEQRGGYCGLAGKVEP